MDARISCKCFLLANIFIVLLLSCSLSHTCTQKKKIKEHRINNPFPLRMSNGIQARDCLEMKAETNYHATDSINI